VVERWYGIGGGRVTPEPRNEPTPPVEATFAFVFELPLVLFAGVEEAEPEEGKECGGVDADEEVVGVCGMGLFWYELLLL